MLNTSQIEMLGNSDFGGCSGMNSLKQLKRTTKDNDL